MGKAFDKINGRLSKWIEAQKMFFVATAPANPDTRINVSPRGFDTFRVLGENRVAWLDLTGSGVETIAHLRAGGEAGGRITLMFCAFEGPARIVRLYGRGTVHEPGDPHYDALRPRFPDMPGERAVISVAVDRVSTSCGFGVPLMDFVGVREDLPDLAGSLGEEGMARYREKNNARSIDGLPGLEPSETTEKLASEAG
jgi:hypothetical protein